MKKGNQGNREKIPATIEQRLAEAEKAISENEILLLTVASLANTVAECIVRMKTPWWKRFLRVFA